MEFVILTVLMRNITLGFLFPLTTISYKDTGIRTGDCIFCLLKCRVGYLP